MPIQKHAKRVSLCNTGLQQDVTYQYCVIFVYIKLQQPSCDTKQHCLVKHIIRKQYEETLQTHLAKHNGNSKCTVYLCCMFNGKYTYNKPVQYTCVLCISHVKR